VNALSAWCCSARVHAAMHGKTDYDVAVFLRDMGDRMTEMNCLADLSTDILYDTGEYVHAMPYRAGFYNDSREPLMHEIRAEGIDL
jgi:uncharacterized protein